MKRRKHFKLDNAMKLVVTSSFIVFIGIFFSKVFSYLYRIIIARSFGPEEYGLFSLATMLLIFIVALFSLGLPEGLVRYVSFYRGKKALLIISYITRYSLLLLTIIGIISALIFFSLSEWIALEIFHDERLISFLRLASITIPFFILANAYLALLRAFEKIGWYSFILNILQNAVKVLMIAFLLFIGMKSNSIMLSYFIGIFAMFLASFFIARRYLKKFLLGKKDPSVKKEKIMKEVFSYSWPLSLMSVASFALYWIDSFTIGYFKTVTEVGFYNAAVPLAAIIMIAPDLIVQLFFPLVTKEYSRKNYFLIEQLSKQVMKWIFIINIPILLVLLVFPGAVINFFFGESYLVAERVLQLLAFGSFFGSLSIIPAQLISMTKKSKVMLINIIFMLLLNLVLNILLVPKYGINGAALSTMIAMILLSIIYIAQTKYYLSFIPLRRKMFKVFLASIIPFALVIYFKHFFAINPFILVSFGALFVILYILFIILFGCLDENDKFVLNNIKNKFLLRKA